MYLRATPSPHRVAVWPSQYAETTCGARVGATPRHGPEPGAARAANASRATAGGRAVGHSPRSADYPRGRSWADGSQQERRPAVERRSMQDRPLVSIGLPVYNGEAYLEEALRCFLDQTVDDLEIVVSDDASTDRTAEISQDLAAKDGRIRYFPGVEQRGASRNFNRVFACSRGRYFRWAAHDDLCAPTYLERCLEALESGSDVVMAHSAAAYIDSSGAPVRTLLRGYVDGEGYVERDVISGDDFGRLAALDPSPRPPAGGHLPLLAQGAADLRAGPHRGVRADAAEPLVLRHRQGDRGRTGPPGPHHRGP